MSSGWRDACQAEIERLGLDPSLGGILDVFESEVDPCRDEPPRFGALGDLPLDVAAHLDDVDRDQAETFARRWGQVLALPGGPAWQVLRKGLQRRMAGILASPPPRARRVRAIVDYAFGQAARLKHGRAELPAPEELPVTWSEIAPGIEHARLEGASRLGPVHGNLVRARDIRLDTFDARAATAAELDAPVVTSGGFFLYSEPDIEPPSRRGDPVGLLVTRGRVINPPWLRRAALVQRTDGRLAIERVVVPGPRWTRAQGRHGGEGRVAAWVGTTRVAEGDGPLPVPLAGAVVPVDTPPWDPGDIVSAIAGGPMLVEDGRVTIDLEAEELAGTAPPITFSQDETHDHNLLPRLAAGLTGDGTLLLAAIDGRRFDRAPGFTLHMTAALLRAHGCSVAMNLDGGSSKRMLIHGEIVDLPSTDLGASGPVRPLHTAIALRPR